MANVVSLSLSNLQTQIDREREKELTRKDWGTNDPSFLFKKNLSLSWRRT